MAAQSYDDPRELRIGYACTVGAFAWWGMVPLFFKLLEHVSATEILVHRVIWTLCCVWIVLFVRGNFAGLRFLAQHRARAGWLCVSGALVAANWLTFTWAVTHGRVLDTSMGYYINPLLSVLLGIVILRERLRPMVQVAVFFAAIAVTVLVFTYGRLPWVSLTLAVTFAFYGLIRKQVAIDTVTGLAVEATFLTPFAIAYGIYLAYTSQGQFIAGEISTNALLMLCGPVTMMPLLMFSAGAVRLPLSTVGLLQYLAPSMTFLTAVFIFNEALYTGRIVAFVFIWLALVILTIDSIRLARAQQPANPSPAQAEG